MFSVPFNDAELFADLSPRRRLSQVVTQNTAEVLDRRCFYQGSQLTLQPTQPAPGVQTLLSACVADRGWGGHGFMLAVGATNSTCSVWDSRGGRGGGDCGHTASASRGSSLAARGAAAAGSSPVMTLLGPGPVTSVALDHYKVVTATSSPRPQLPTCVHSALDGQLINALGGGARGEGNEEEEEEEAAATVPPGQSHVGVSALAVRGAVVVTGDWRGGVTARDFTHAVERLGDVELPDDPLGVTQQQEEDGWREAGPTRFWSLPPNKPASRFWDRESRFWEEKQLESQGLVERMRAAGAEYPKHGYSLCHRRVRPVPFV